MTDPEIQRIDTKVVYKNRWMTVREDRVRRSNGDSGIFGIVDKPDFSLIIPYDGEHFHLVQQYRYPVAGRFWEFPQGSRELKPETSPEDVAIGELREETGLVAASMVKLGKFFQAYGYANQAIHVFLATELDPQDTSLDAEEHGLVASRFTRRQCDEMLSNGDISDLATLAAFHLFDRHDKG